MYDYLYYTIIRMNHIANKLAGFRFPMKLYPLQVVSIRPEYGTPLNGLPSALIAAMVGYIIYRFILCFSIIRVWSYSAHAAGIRPFIAVIGALII